MPRGATSELLEGDRDAGLEARRARPSRPRAKATSERLARALWGCWVGESPTMRRRTLPGGEEDPIQEDPTDVGAKCLTRKIRPTLALSACKEDPTDVGAKCLKSR